MNTSTMAAASALDADLLIAEAKQRTRRRRLLALGASLVVVTAAVSVTLAPRSSANSLGVCATPPSGFHARSVTDAALGPPTAVLTNFRFGRMDDVFGITDPHLRWPANGVLVAVGNWPPDSTVSRAGPLRVTRAAFAGMEGSTLPTAHFGVTAEDGRILDTYVTVGALTPGTIAAANEALAGVRTCSA